MLLAGNLTIATLIANLIALGVGMTLHEFMHNYVAWKMGDPEPARQGRLTLNPLVHINWIGWLMFALLGFGILGSAPISPYRMPRENRRWRWFAAVAAGPLANLAIAVVVAIVVRIIGLQNVFGMPELIQAILIQTILLNVLLFVFNLLPLFPIDGWHIMYSLLPAEYAETWQRYQQTTYYIFIFLLLLSFIRLPGIPNLFGLLIGQPTQQITALLLGL
ncbi:site-2 protease family protein [Anaerolineae bacterium CFX9]|nr:site-2 protease family protein [Oscillatoria laete-virens]MDL1900959.1 site-2 protease family protein [Anaerolineae bacterium CFX9]MDL5054573.1 site-2 protease family protein [Oscillatoria laete-virens NRMC-F 0139]